MGNAGGAAQIALVMLGFVILLIWAERRSRARQRFHHTSSRLRPIEGLPLRGAKAWAATAACALPVLLGFVLPAGVLANYAFLSSTAAWTPEFFRSEEHTSELQSLMRISYAVFCLKKKNNNNTRP